MRTRIIAVAGFLVLSACSSRDASSQATGKAPSGVQVSAAAAKSSGDPSANDVSNYTLDMDKMTKYLNVMKDLAIASEKDSTVESTLSMDGNATLAQSIEKLDESPVARRALKSAGMSSRDYVMTGLAYLQAGMAAGLMKSVPNYKIPAGQNMKNIDFVNAHGAEIEAKMKQMGADVKG